MDMAQLMDSIRQHIDAATPDVSGLSRTDVVTLAVTSYLKGQVDALEHPLLAEHPHLRDDFVVELRRVIDGLVDAA